MTLLATEDQLHRAVVEHLRWRAAPGVAWYHPANGGMRHTATAGKLKASGVRPGVPDLALVIGGQAYYLEFKREKSGRLSKAQGDMQRELREAGAVVATAYGLDEALSILAEWGALAAHVNGKGRSERAERTA